MAFLVTFVIMLNVTVNNSASIKTNLQVANNLFEGLINDSQVNGSFIKLNNYQYHLLHNNTSYNIDVVKINFEEKTMTLKINGEKHDVVIKDKYDELLKNLGLDSLVTKKVANIKAPMPGMVLKIMVNENDSVKKGDTLIILEAMKMENSLKAPADGVVKKIAVNQGAAVEKNQLLIQF